MQRQRGGFEEGKWMGWVDERIKGSIGRGGGGVEGGDMGSAGPSRASIGCSDVDSVRFVQHGDVVGVAQLRGCSHTHKEASSSLTGRWCVGVGLFSAQAARAPSTNPTEPGAGLARGRRRVQDSRGATRTEYLQSTVENRAHWLDLQGVCCVAGWQRAAGMRADARRLVACHTPPLMHR